MKRIALCVILFASAWAHAANFTVTNLLDSGAGSLREAIAQANALAGADTIDFAVTGTITLTGGQLTIEGPLTIAGPGAASLVLHGNGSSRVINIVESTNPGCPALSGPSDYFVTLSGMTVRNGRRLGDSSVGGILSAKSLVLNGMVIDDNQGKNAGGAGFYIQYPGQSLTIVNTAFTNNLAKPLAAVTGASTSGGGLVISEFCPNTRTLPVTVTISDSLFTGNRVQPVALHGRGGAIATYSDADITITNTRIVGNGIDAPSPVPAGIEYTGGGIHGRSKSLRIERSEVTDNDAVSDNLSAYGGGLSLFNDVLALQVAGGAMDVRIVNSTISGNLSTGSAGAINAYGYVALTFQNSTIANNMADAARTGGIRLVTGATVPASASNALPPALTLTSAILANSSPPGDIGIGNALIPSTVANATNSLVENPCRACGLTFSGSGNLIGADPGLAALAFGSAVTRTHALLPTSLAIDTGANPEGLASDQRGPAYPRVLGVRTDMGAFEYPKSCAGFTDVDPAVTLFCANMEWLRNRAITLGCGSGVYCPANNVLREQMAAFMNRLGKTLTPEMIYLQQSIGATALPGPIPNPAARRCITAASTAAGYPRQAVVTASLSGLANGSDAAFRAALVVSYDGINWDNLAPGTSVGLRSTSLANRWSEGLLVEKVDLPPGVTPMFAINIRRDDQTSTTGDLTDGRCQIEVAIHNRNGAASPY